MTTLTSTTSGITLVTPAYTNPILIQAGTAVGNTAGIGIQSSLTTIAWTITNSGAVTGTTYGINLLGTGTVINSGTISSTAPGGQGISTNNGGFVSNLSTGTISGSQFGITLYSSLGTAATIINAGLIKASTGTSFGHAVLLAGNSSDFLNNSGTIQQTGTGTSTGDLAAVRLIRGGTILNTGLISVSNTTGMGIVLNNGGTITNLGTVSAASSAPNLTNGTGLAINMTGTGTNLLQLGVASTINGTASANSTGTNTLELLSGTSTGTVNASNFLSFQTGTVDAGANWVLQGTANNSFARLLNSGTLTNTGLIAGASVSLINGGVLSNAATATISGSANVLIGGDAVNATVINSGRIIATGANPWAIILSGNVTNNAGGVIQALPSNGYGVQISTGTVLNNGTITGGTATGGAAIALVGGATSTSATAVVNNTGTLLSSGGFGITASAAVTATITNSGQIQGARYGVNLAGTGTITNNASGTISSAIGVLISNAGTVTNAGGAVITASSVGISFAGGGTVTNSGQIQGGLVGVSFSNGGSVTNNASGSISANGPTGATGVLISGGGTVVNNASATISAASVGVSLVNGGTLTNSGQIQGSWGVIGSLAAIGVTNSGTITGQTDGVYLYNGGTVNNTGAAALIQGTRYGIYGSASSGATVSVTNSGKISATGSAGVAVTFVNSGYVNNLADGTISGTTFGIVTGGFLSLVNAGSISASGAGGYGVSSDAGGIVTNLAGGTISGSQFGVMVFSTSSTAPATLVNQGNITASTNNNTFGHAVILAGNSSDFLNNSGTILQTGTGASVGDITAVRLGRGGTLLNTGLISATGTLGIGVVLNVGGTIKNLGTISAAGTAANTGNGVVGAAVYLAGTGANTLQLGVASTIMGTAVANAAGTNTLELLSGTGTGTITGLGANYIGFQNAVVDTGANWFIGGVASANTIIAGSNFTNRGTLTVNSQLSTAGTLNNQTSAAINGNIAILAGGSLTNSGSIIGTVNGFNSAILTNSGTITGSGGIAVSMIDQNGSIGNTINNFGVIIANNGGTAVNLGDIGVGVNVLNLNAGQTIIGSIVGQGSINRLNLIGASTGTNAPPTLSGLGSTITGFNQITATSGSNWQLTGNNSVSNTQTFSVVGANLTNASNAAFTGALTLGSAGTLTNLGTLSANSNGTAVIMNSGANRLILSPTASVTGIVSGGGTSGSGTQNWLVLESATNPVTTTIISGTITGIGTQYIGVNVQIDTGATWTASGANTIASGLTMNILGTLENRGTLNNSGLISNSGSLDNYGTINGSVSLLSGGQFTNQNGAVFNDGGAAIAGQQVTITNSGTLSGNGTNGYGASIAGGGTINNSGGITGGFRGILFGGSPAVVNNSGYIEGSIADGIRLLAGGTISSTAGGVIKGGTAGIYATATVVGTTVPDAITINNGSNAIIGGTGTSGVGISLAYNGTIINAAGAYITGGSAGIILSGGNTVSINNSGSITDNGIGTWGISAASSINVNIINSSLISGKTYGVALGGGTIVNESAGIIAGTSAGITASGFITLTNSGTIGNTTASSAVVSTNGGSITNATSGIISGVQFGISLSSTNVANTVINAGQILGASNATFGQAVFLSGNASDSLSNSGTITQSGTAAGAGDLVAVRLAAGGTITNTGFIGVTNSLANAIVLNVGGTITNLGTVSAASSPPNLTNGAGLAINMTGTAAPNLLRLGVGSTIIGTASANSAGTNTLELLSGTSTGTVNASNFLGFQTGTIDANANWVLQGTANNSFARLLNSGTLTNTGLIAGAAVSLINGSVLSNAATATISGAANTLIGGNAANVINSGRIIATGTNPWAILLSGNVTNNAGGIIQAQSGNGFGAQIINGTVLNNGVITGGTGTGGAAVALAGAVVTTPGTAFVNNTGTLQSSGGFGISSWPSITATITNSGLIQAGRYGVFVDGTGTITNSGTITSSSTSSTDAAGVQISSGGTVVNNAGATISAASVAVSLVNGGTLTNSGQIQGNSGVIGSLAAIGVTNSATITGQTDGVYLNNGGTVTNTGTAALIQGTRYGIYGSASSGVTVSVVNSGKISATGSAGVAVAFANAGYVSNQAGGTITGAFNGITASGFLSLINAGFISGGSAGTAAITAVGGGIITNQAGGSISGGQFGVVLFSPSSTAPVTLVNQGNITASTNNTSFGHAVILGGNASDFLNNSGTILQTGTAASVGDIAAVRLGRGGTLLNTGLISATGTQGIGVVLNVGGTIINFGTISAAGTAANTGNGVVGAAIYLASTNANTLQLGITSRITGTAVANAAGTNTLELLSGTAAGTITGLGRNYVGFQNAVVDAGATWTLSGTNTIITGNNFTNRGIAINAGTFSGAMTLAASSVMTNAASAILSNGTLSSAIFGTGTSAAIINNGTIQGAQSGTALISLAASSTLTNIGQIIQTGSAATGLSMANGGIIVNSGTISAAGGNNTGIVMASGTITNSSLIIAGSGQSTGISMTGAGSINNTGTISAIGALSQAVILAGGGTVTNSGSILTQGSARTAINFGAGNSRLAISGSSTIVGQVTAAGTGNVLELDGNGTTLSGFGTQYTGFQTINVKGDGWVLADTLTNTNILMQTTGTVTVSQALAASNTITMGGTSSAGAASGNIIISTPGTALAATVSDFGNGESITLTGLAYQASDVVDVVSSGGNVFLILSHVAGDGTKTQYYSIKLDPNAHDQNYKMRQAQGGNGVTVYDDGTPCYVHGTLILTDRGEVPVEDLQIGDNVITASGAVRPIRWLGRRSYNGRFIKGRLDVLPVRIRQGALDGVLPKRDLLVSPLHAMFIDGVLVPAGRLVNGVSIIQEQHVETVSYVHIELDTHDVVIAEGAASETYVEDNNRKMFHNAHTYAGEGASKIQKRSRKRNGIISANYYATRVVDGIMLESIRKRLMEHVIHQKNASAFMAKRSA
ncbi:Hint domain-containing protein [Granulibacter bethesdensis]|uniref:Hemagglutinin-related protein n=1 Tax=Granulibacter bethesdensis (strain ATCC BAA-1260 / CGDNIH1) TaxID=391165 RepID=Q0BT19_GRABC|nr:Hint domain-containing protein [Granulibacter bethesdensis]ABI62033.1 Hemagglutinin-related protein [Granulibacter bethesdensis CGDNIH1]APH51854.1 Hemagglutinin-related protein [Granulibacter bethesdensis]APH64545.1 Hemagglutinin-related protein [Granulibacter bethesdensis]